MTRRRCRLPGGSAAARALAFTLALAAGRAASAQATQQPTQQAPPQATTVPAAPTRILALEAPAGVASYTRVGRRDFGTPTLGVGYTYADPADSAQVRLSAYLYEREAEARTLTPAAAVAAQVALFRQALAVEQARGMFEAYVVPVEGPDSVVVGGGRPSVPGFHVFVAQRRAGRVYLSFFAVYAVADGFIKVRCTVPEAGWQRRDFQGIARTLVRRTLAGA